MKWIRRRRYSTGCTAAVVGRFFFSGEQWCDQMMSSPFLLCPFSAHANHSKQPRCRLRLASKKKKKKKKEACHICFAVHLHATDSHIKYLDELESNVSHRGNQLKMFYLQYIRRYRTDSFSVYSTFIFFLCRRRAGMEGVGTPDETIWKIISHARCN